jgi:HEAT repeat protein
VIKKEADKPEGMRDGEMIDTAARSIEGIRFGLVTSNIAVIRTDKAPPKKAAAAAELAKIGQGKPELIKRAIPALKEEDAGVRASALQALARAQPEPPEVVPALVGMLRNLKEERAVRLVVIGYLGALGGNAVEAVPFLEVMLDREKKKLGPSRDKDLYEALTKALAAIKQP